MTYPHIPASAPFLFENQDRPFAGDTFMERDFLALKERFNLNAAVETGTCYGSTTLWLTKHFPEKVITIEISAELASVAYDRIAEAGVWCEQWIGDSGKFMAEAAAIIKQAEMRAIFFLDAHFEQHCPLLDELKAIAQAGIKPVIAIHDFQVPGRPDLGYDTWNGQPFKFSWIRPYLEAIYGVNNYGHHYNSEATGAKRGCIYIYPLLLQA